MGDLLRRAALVNGREREKAGEAGGGSASVDPGELKGSEGEREIFWAGNEAAFFRLHECGGDAGAIEGLEHFAFGAGPLVGVAFAGRDESSDGSTGHAAGRLDEHLQIESISKAPLNLSHGVARQREHGFDSRERNSGHKVVLRQRGYCA